VGSAVDVGEPADRADGRVATLSVIVTIVDGGAALRRCLLALAHQIDAPDMEVIVPYDDTVADIEEIAASHRHATFLALGRLETRKSAHTMAGQHELFDRRRAAGLAAARGDIVALLEDRGVPRFDWARHLVRSQGPGRRVVGGAIENSADHTLNWAVYFCDFGRDQLPFQAGPVGHLSDVNVSYDRRLLLGVAASWASRFHEPVVHEALRRQGHSLWLTPDVVVSQVRDGLTWRRLIRERVAWGRLFGAIRSRECGLAGRFLFAASMPIVPLLMFARLARRQTHTRATCGRFMMATPAIVLLLLAWAIGEAVGTITRDG
jgi:hypothetical protein